MNAKNVKVKALLDPAGAIDFEVDGVKAKHSQLKLDKDSGAHAIDFELHDHTGRGLQFDTGDPLWVGEDCPCPPPPGVNSNQLSVTDCRERTLSTIDLNSDQPRELRYQLNFVGSDGSRESCDPIIRNGGGPPI